MPNLRLPRIVAWIGDVTDVCSRRTFNLLIAPKRIDSDGKVLGYGFEDTTVALRKGLREAEDGDVPWLRMYVCTFHSCVCVCVWVCVCVCVCVCGF